MLASRLGKQRAILEWSRGRDASNVKVTTEKLPRSQVVLNIEVEQDQMDKSMQRAYRRIASRVNIPGFRKGKAPRNVVERYYGREAIINEALDILVPEVYSQAIEEHQIEPVAQPTIDLVQTEPPIFKATVSIRPSIELADASELSFTLEPEAITDERIEETIEDIRKRYAPWEKVERAAQEGDLLSLDVESSAAEGGPFINDTAVTYIITPGLSFPITGFPEQLVGIEPGGEKEFTLTAPDDYPQEAFRGQEISFKVKVNEVQEKKLPELDDEFVKGLPNNVETVAELRQWIRDQLEQAANEAARRKVETDAVEALIAASQIEYPEILVEHELDHLVDQHIASDHGGSLDDFVRTHGKTREELRDEQREEAEQRVLRTLILDELAKKEGITVSDDDVTREIMSFMQQATSEQQLNSILQAAGTQQGRETLGRMALTRKTLNWLVATVTGTPIEEPSPFFNVSPPPAEAGDESPAPDETPAGEVPSAEKSSS